MRKVELPAKQKVSRAEKQQMLDQKSIVIWLLGYSGAGKTTLANYVEQWLFSNGYHTTLIDGDDLRFGLNSDLGFSQQDRKENIRRAAEVSKLFMNSGVITICAFISPTQEIRNLVRQIIGESYFEVFVNCSVNACEKRDIKGLYKKARAGDLKNFTGIDSVFETPLDSDLIVDSEFNSVETCGEQILEKILERIK